MVQPKNSFKNLDDWGLQNINLKDLIIEEKNINKMTKDKTNIKIIIIKY